MCAAPPAAPAQQPCAGRFRLLLAQQRDAPVKEQAQLGKPGSLLFPRLLLLTTRTLGHVGSPAGSTNQL